MKAFVINLKRSADRRRHMIAELERVGLEYEIVEAVDGGEMSDDDFEGLVDKEAVAHHPEWLTNRMLATSLSHIKAYKRICDLNLSHALILEDDVELRAPDLLGLLDGLERTINGGTVVLLHFISFEPLGLSRVNARPLTDDRSLYFPLTLDRMGSAAAYVITKDAATVLAEKLIPLSTAPDSWNDFVARDRLERLMVVYPQAASVVGAKSTIYLDSQTSFRARLTEVVDKYKIPILFSYFRNRRLANVKNWSRFYFTDEKSPIDPTPDNQM